MLVAHGKSEESALEELRAQIAEDQEAQRTRAELEKEREEERKKTANWKLRRHWRPGSQRPGSKPRRSTKRKPASADLL